MRDVLTYPEENRTFGEWCLHAVAAGFVGLLKSESGLDFLGLLLEVIVTLLSSSIL